ncbi:GH92 family glycosyl hydrolase [Alistipes shahii]|uniref:GH92 family glycosyl hydrolase n=3 Tax=Alistipes TaxID=239759 RepID=UPI001459B446|nr:GH92 family glycosyl hydrolase [Alistipes shahii]NMF24650.1 glycoside hydrolase family 125 protein [Alistipes shahii]
MNITQLLTAAGLLLTACAQPAAEENYTRFVDPKIGTGGHGHVFVGANVPFGMVQVGPTSIPQAWDWTSGYHASDSTVIGFSHTHLSGTGIGDLFDITVMPVTGEVTYARGEEKDPASGMWSYADRTKEITKPGYYSVPLTRYGITAEMTATERVGLHRYTFPASDAAAVVFDLENGGCWDKATQTHLEKEGDSRITGWRYSTGWAKDQRVYFVAEFSKPFAKFETVGDKYARASFATTDGEQVLLKVALSPVSIEGAKANLVEELPGWDFDATVKAADAKWNAELSKVKVTTTDEAAKRIFYTALYHTMVAPSLFCDVNGDYYGSDHEIHRNADFTNYTTFSLWDTYRAAMPLMTILHPEKMPDIIRTMLAIADEQGRLPVWHLWGNETDCMVGNPGIPVVADALVKGIEGFDREKAFEAIKKTAMNPDRGNGLRMQYGYIPCDLFNEAVAYDMEYALADGAAARAAEVLGRMEDAKFFEERSHSYRNYFDPSTRFMRGRDSRKGWRTPFDPFHSTHRADDYCEGNAWQYTWLAPHDVEGLQGCFGSRAKLIEKLDSLFIVSPVIQGGNTSPDISGLIGQYAHGNEPSHHILYLYTMLGQPWKTADKVREVLTTLYHDAPDGLSGNEDVGQMSAWYILSSLGMYEAEPAGGRYWFGSPLFDRAELKVEGGVFTITAENNSAENKYIQRVWLDGQLYTKPWIAHADVVRGGELRFEMGAEPKVWYCPQEPEAYADQRPEKRLFTSEAVEAEIGRVSAQLTNDRIRWMFRNCFPNTLDTTVHYREDEDGNPDTYVYTGDIPAMWLRDSGAQVWPYVQLCGNDVPLRRMIAGVIRRQFKLINIDPYANAFNDGPTGAGEDAEFYPQNPWVFERKWEIDSHCYPIRLAHHYWKTTGDVSVFDAEWVAAMRNIIKTLREQQRKEGPGPYTFLRTTDRQLDTKCCVGRGNPVNPVGLIASAFRPSDDATTFEFLVPSNFMVVSSLRKAAEILTAVNDERELADECTALADEVAAALQKYAVVEHPEFGKIYAFEVDGFGSAQLMDDANVPSLLAMPYLGDVERTDPIYENTRRFVWSTENPYFWRGAAGEGIGGPHIGVEMIWPMSIMMRAFTATDDNEIRDCIAQLLTTDAGTGFMHESFSRHDAAKFTRAWFAWQNTLFGELILKIVNDGKTDLLNSIN